MFCRLLASDYWQPTGKGQCFLKVSIPAIFFSVPYPQTYASHDASCLNDELIMPAQKNFLQDVAALRDWYENTSGLIV